MQKGLKFAQDIFKKAGLLIEFSILLVVTRLVAKPGIPHCNVQNNKIIQQVLATMSKLRQASNYCTILPKMYYYGTGKRKEIHNTSSTEENKWTGRPLATDGKSYLV